MTTTPKPLVIGNWKMNLDYVEAVHLGQQLGVMLKNKPAEHTDIVVVPPFVDIRSMTSIIESERIAMDVGAQHVSAYDNGAYTGEISTTMLKRLNVQWVLVGHSERRAMYDMTDEVVLSTLQAVVRSGLKVVLCVGEALSVREANEQNDFVTQQLKSALEGLTASSDQVGAMTIHLRSVLAQLSLGAARVLYGGSVNGENAATLLGEGGVDGFLVGGASLKAESFMSIIQTCDDCYDVKR